MTNSTLIRWGALSAVLGGVLYVISDLWFLLVEGLLGDVDEPLSEGIATGWFVGSTGVSLLGVLLVLFGLVGLNLHQSEAAGGVLGGLGFLVAFLGTALVVGIHWSFLFVYPAVAVESPAALDTELVSVALGVGGGFSLVVMAVGWALFGIGALRARRCPGWVATLLIIGALLHIPLIFIISTAGIVFGVPVALLGYFTFVGERMSAEPPSPVS